MVTGTVPIQAIFKNDGFPTSSSDIHARQTIVPAQLVGRLYQCVSVSKMDATTSGMSTGET
jgi:hypothetical protein